MSRINHVKKILRDHGGEMDADDVLAKLRQDPRYRTGLARDQISTTLSSLWASDPDIVRTRRGLYQFRAAPTQASRWRTDPSANERPALLPDRAAAVDAMSPAGGARSADFASADLELAQAAVAVVVELGHARTTLTAHLGVTLPDPVLLTWARQLTCRRNPNAGTVSVQGFAGNDDAVAALVDLIGAAQPIHGAATVVVAGDTILTTAAAALAAVVDIAVIPLDLTYRHDIDRSGTADTTTFSAPVTVTETVTGDGPDSSDPTLDGDADTEGIGGTAPPVTRSAGGITPATVRPLIQPRTLTAATHQHRPSVDPAEQLDTLSWRDDTNFHRPVHGISHHKHPPRPDRDAARLGDVYAARWWAVSTDAEHDDLITWATCTTDIPRRLWADLLAFAQHHGLNLTGAFPCHDHLRRGFWTGVQHHRPIHTTHTRSA